LFNQDYALHFKLLSIPAMKTKTIRQTVSFKASPKEVYEMIMDAGKHSSLTGTTVKMSREVNGKFEAFDGYCHGYNIELEEGKKIAQAWHFREDGWPDDHFSICTFQFEPTEKGTKLTFSQVGVPEHKYDEIKDGWRQYYWKPMANYFKD
jgi:activator of HSP90 ATPase